ADVEFDERMRVGPLEFVNRAFKRDHLALVEHREAVVRHGRCGHDHHGTGKSRPPCAPHSATPSISLMPRSSAVSLPRLVPGRLALYCRMQFASLMSV